MLYTAAVTLLALLASAGLTLAGLGAPAAVAHLAFAVGIVPLIFAAMSHFVPVLTRTGDGESAIRLIPAGAQLAGMLAVVALQGLAPRWLLMVAAAGDLLLAGALLSWVAARARACLGAPHPGWRWYGAALGCLMLTMVVVPPMVVNSELYAPLRLFHLHFNVLGLVGLAALGTLPVLLPTVLGRPDPEAAWWLRRRLWPVAVGALAVAVGSDVAWPLAATGGAVVFGAALSLGGQWIRRFGLAVLCRDGISSALLAAVGGLLILLAGGVAHGGGVTAGRPAIVAWGVGFLLPLVTGALGQLLPVWRWPGLATPARAAMRSRLAAGGRLRAVLFLAAAMAFVVGEGTSGAALAAAGLGLFVVSLARAVRVAAPAR